MKRYKLVVGKPGVHVKLAGYGSFRTPFSLILNTKSEAEKLIGIIKTIYKLDCELIVLEDKPKVEPKKYPKKEEVKEEEVKEESEVATEVVTEIVTEEEVKKESKKQSDKKDKK